MDNMYQKAYNAAEKKALSSNNGELEYSGEIYKFTFYHNGWYYKIEDQEGNFIVNLNVKGLNKAKKEFIKWLQS